MNYPRAIVALYYKSRGNFLRNLVSTTWFYLRGKSIIAHKAASIRGLGNVEIARNRTLLLGLFPNNFGSPSDRTFLSVDGSLKVSGNFDIGRGARVSIGKNAKMSVGSGFINNNCLLAIEHQLTIGDDCAIGWNVQILDSDYHTIMIDNVPSSSANEGVVVGTHVWIGSNVSILKNVVIPDGSVIASGSIVNKKFTEPNCLIGGAPAKILKRNVQWK